MRKQVLLSFLLAAPVLLAGQMPGVDSLLALAAAAPTDSVRVQRTMEAGKLYLGSQPDSALAWFDRAERIARQTGYRRGIARCKINSAYALLDLGQHDRALQCCFDALPICQELSMGKELVATYNSIGNVYNYRGDRPKAIEYYLQALKTMDWAQGLPPNFPLGVRNNLAMLYIGMREYNKGLEMAGQCYHDALAQGEEHSAALAAQHIANAMLGLNREKEAAQYFEEGLRLARKTSQLKVGVALLTNLGGLNAKHGRFAEARSQYDEAMSMCRELNDPYSFMLTEHGFGELAFFERRYDEARTHTMVALNYAREMHSNDYMQALLLLLSDIAVAQGDLGKWDQYRHEYQTLRDTLLNTAVVYATTELETRYQTEQKQQQIKLQTMRLRQRNGLMFGFAGLSVLLGLLGFFSYRSARQRRRLAEQEVVIQQQTIRELEKEKQLAAVDAMVRGQEEERGRLARDLHDGLGGLLSGIKQSVHALQAGPFTFREQKTASTAVAAEPMSAASTADIAASLRWVEERLDHSIHELRQVSRNLMPEALLRFGLKDAVHDYCDHLAHAQGLKIHFQAYGLDERLEQHAEVILFRVIQELLNNIVKHAAATEAIVQLVRDEGRLHLTVEDNGRGFDPKNITSPGIGWLNIRSRVDYLGGRLEVQSAPGKGTSVGVEVNVN